ncbi:twin-arginine translocation pathway signal [Flavobacteriales bacterium 34_180_T64]|nr:twin-arginine translocation pathway signal [Flavobacteriales bacterium 34_180_T64]
MDRRGFIKNSTLASSLFFIPSFVRAFENIAANKLGFKRLVIIQLSGGNDGLNTIIPFNNDIYYRERPKLAIQKKHTLKLSDELGLHSSLLPLKRLYDEGSLSVINNVGYPNPNRSHFRATDIWQTASHSNEQLNSGWIGRYLDQFSEQSHNAIEIDESLSLALKGERKNGIAVKNPRMLYRTSQDPYLKNVLNHYDDAHLNEHNLGYLYKTMIAAESSATYIYETSKTIKSSQDYPNFGFANQLKTTAQFINSGLDTRVYYSSLNGFDTHVNQPNIQKRLLNIYAKSMASFVDDLKSQNTFNDTLILTFSEFGRRVKQNASNGTDHGSANNVFIIGGQLKTPGLYNNLANLNDLDANGNIKFEIDFRRIYATVLKKWLEVDDSKILNTDFNQLNFI